MGLFHMLGLVQRTSRSVTPLQLQIPPPPPPARARPLQSFDGSVLVHSLLPLASDCGCM